MNTNLIVKGTWTFTQDACFALRKQGVNLTGMPTNKGVSIPLGALEAAGVKYIRGNPEKKGLLTLADPAAAAALSCPHCGRALETPDLVAAGLCTSDDCPRHDAPDLVAAGHDAAARDRRLATLDYPEHELAAIRAALAATRCEA